MSEKFTAGQLFRKRAAIYSHEWFMRPGAMVVYFVSDRFFAASAFTINNHAVIGGSNQLYLLKNLFEDFALAKNVLAFRLFEFSCLYFHRGSVLARNVLSGGALKPPLKG